MEMERKYLRLGDMAKSAPSNSATGGEDDTEDDPLLNMAAPSLLSALL